ncbi:MAG: DNA primase [Rubrivivax sp.]|nr:MAG: DNA primase [Rubrivivax sp.]
MMAVYFQIPHADKDQAKALGARWSTELELWYAATDIVAGRLAERWKQATPPTPLDTFPGEDRAFGQATRLYVDMIPSSCWLTNVRSSVSADDWKQISLGVKQRAHRHCEVCHAPADTANKVYLEAHERFEYVNGVQVLRRLVCLCSTCHGATHFGHATAKGQEQEARAHLMHINGWNSAELEAHIRSAYALWSSRSCQQWGLDLSILMAAGVQVRLPSQDERLRQGVDLSALRA